MHNVVIVAKCAAGPTGLVDYSPVRIGTQLSDSCEFLSVLEFDYLAFVSCYCTYSTYSQFWLLEFQ